MSNEGTIAAAILTYAYIVWLLYNYFRKDWYAFIPFGLFPLAMAAMLAFALGEAYAN